jgi:periplasmic protein TonB
MKFALFLLLILFSYTVNAQTDSMTFVMHVDKNTIIVSEAEFPGGANAWYNYVGHNVKYPEWALRRGIRGTVVVKFVVETDGTITNVKAVSGPSQLWQSAIDVIKKSPKWLPSKRNGVPIKSDKTQPINFG